MNLYYHFSLTLVSLFFLSKTPEITVDKPISNWETGITSFAPTVDLGNDTVNCGPVVLDAGNAGATFLWSTGATTQTISVSMSDTIWVDVTDLTGTTRDSIVVTVLSTPNDPVTGSQSICGAGNAEFTGSSNGSAILWYDAMSGGNLIGEGDTLNVPLTSTTTLYAEAINFSSRSVGEEDKFVGASNKNFAVNDRGLKFDAFSNLIIQTVKVYPVQPSLAIPFSFDVELRDDNDSVLAVRSFSYDTAAAEVVLPLWFEVAPGTDYKIVNNNLTGGLFTSSLTVPNFPYVIPNIISITDTETSSNHYYTFFDWKVIGSSDYCSSNRISSTITVLPAPIIDFGRDTVLCNSGSLVLDATNSGATYQWSDGSTSSTLVATSTDTFWVNATIGSCTNSDTIIVGIFNNQPNPNIGNLDICGPGEVGLSPGFGKKILWHDSIFGGNILSYVDTFVQQVDTTRSVFAQNVDFLYQQTGPVDLSGGSGSLLTAAPNRGLRFNVEENLIIESVKVFPLPLSTTSPMTFDVELQTLAGTVIDSRSFSYMNPDTVLELGLWMEVGPGTGYRLVANNIVGGKLFATLNVGAFLYSLPNLVSITSSQPVTNHYFYFYDWKVIPAIQACYSNRVETKITVQPVPVIDLGADTLLCGGTTLSLDITNNGATYLWNDGLTIPTRTVSTNDTLWATVLNGFCDASDTLIVYAKDIPTYGGFADTTICGPQSLTLTPGHSGEVLLWSNELNPNRVLGFENSFTSYFSDSILLFSETLNHASESLGAIDNTVTGTSNFSVTTNRGIVFDAYNDFYIKGISVYPAVGNPGSPIIAFDIELRDSANNLVNSRHFNIANPLNREDIDLWFKVEAGNGWRLIATNFENVGLQFNTSIGSLDFEIPGVAKMTSTTPASNHYYYLYDWQIVKPSFGCSSGQNPVQINVNLPLNFPDSIFECDEFVLNAGVEAASYSWNTGSAIDSILVTEGGLYFLTVSDGQGCDVTDSVIVEIPEDAGLQDDGILCGNILSTIYGEDATYLWSTSDTTSSIQVTNTGTYSVIVSEPRGCVLFDTIQVTGFSDFPIVDLGSDTSVCTSLVLDAENQGSSYLWSTGDTTQTVNLTSSGNYYVIVTNQDNCQSTDSISLSVTPHPAADFFVPDTVVNHNLTVTFNNLSTFGTYFWDFGDGTTSTLNNPIHVFPDTGFYCTKLVVNDILNSCGSDTITKCFQILEFNVNLSERIIPGLKVYPNPVYHSVFIEFLDMDVSSWSFELMDLKGRIILEEEKTSGTTGNRKEINLEQLVPGMYFMRVRKGNMTQLIKILKE